MSQYFIYFRLQIISSLHSASARYCFRFKLVSSQHTICGVVILDTRQSRLADIPLILPVV